MALFSGKWKEDGWTTLQDADAEKHVLEIACRAEKGTVVEVRIRHNDGEETQGQVLYNGQKALPMDLAEFKKLYNGGKLDIK